ncbi:MAG TPA: adenylate/guanylate cyclase domain-containing protein [Terriglobales bacterium]|nr:adenylate/guanylate cyclase domain-containing protein [Terriglobales bacterium]
MTPARWRRLAQSATARALLLGLLVSVAVTGVSRLGALSGWETRAIDLFLFFRDRVPTPEIVLVLIDDDAFEQLGQRQPLPRRELAALGEFLLASGARVVGYDVHLPTATEPAADAALIALTRRWADAPGGRLVFTSVATPVAPDGRERYALTPPFSPELRPLFGYANAPIGADGVVRRLAPVLPAERGYLPSFAVAVLAAHEGYSADALTRALADPRGPVLPVGDPARGITRSEPVALATLAERVWRIDYAGPPNTFASFPAGALLTMIRSGVTPDRDNPFRDRIVLVGASFAESRDFYPTPLGLMAGVEIQANILHTLLARRALLPPHWAVNLALMALGCLWITLLSLRLRALWVALLSAGLVALFVAAGYEAYSRGYWLDFVAPLAVMLGYRVVAGALARRRLRKAFGEFVNPEVLQQVLREGVHVGSGGLRHVSVLMSDVRGFTAMSERLAPDKVSETMNAYFTAMVDVLMAERGMVQDFIGDGILAIFGAPADDPDHAWHAVRAALGMRAALGRLNERWAAEGQPTLAMGAAVNTGEAFAGVMGAPQKKKYTVLGDVVNTTSRMEGQNKELGTEILISASTLAAVAGRVVVRERGAVRVKGKAEPVPLFELLAEAPPREGPDPADCPPAPRASGGTPAGAAGVSGLTP